MTITRTALQAAAFWDQAVCLDCGHAFTDESDPDEGAVACPHCGSAEVHDATGVLKIVDAIIEEEE